MSLCKFFTVFSVWNWIRTSASRVLSYVLRSYRAMHFETFPKLTVWVRKLLFCVCHLLSVLASGLRKMFGRTKAKQNDVLYWIFLSIWNSFITKMNAQEALKSIPFITGNSYFLRTEMSILRISILSYLYQVCFCTRFQECGCRQTVLKTEQRILFLPSELWRFQHCWSFFVICMSSASWIWK